MAMVGKIRRLHYRQRKSVREIARMTSLSRNTVRRYLAEDTPTMVPRKTARSAPVREVVEPATGCAAGKDGSTTASTAARPMAIATLRL